MKRGRDSDYVIRHTFKNLPGRAVGRFTLGQD